MTGFGGVGAFFSACLLPFSPFFLCAWGFFLFVCFFFGVVLFVLFCFVCLGFFFFLFVFFFFWLLFCLPCKTTGQPKEQTLLHRSVP